MKRANSGIISGDLVDSISSLPDSTLSLILSLIPTKNAVATSVLSKRWESVWKSVHNLDFNLDFCVPSCKKRCHKDCIKARRNEDMKFAHFVNNVMLLHDGGFLIKFSLVWKPKCIPIRVISCLNTAIARNIQELYLCVDHSSEPFEIPSSVFSCETLKSMVLDGNMFVSDSIAVCLPKLESLTLVSIYFLCEETFQKLISGCPVLNILVVVMDMNIMAEYILTYRDVAIVLFTFIISSTSLKRFHLNVESDCEWFKDVREVEDVFYCSLELESPSIEYIHLEGFVATIFVRGSLSSLDKADLTIYISEEDLYRDRFCKSLVETIRAFDCAKSLRLSEYVLRALSRAGIGLSTKFNRLTELTTGATCCYCSTIQDFIQCSDNLEVLIVNKEINCEDYEDDYHTWTNWDTPMEIPRCLLNSLKTVEFGDYAGFEYEIEMISYMLMHGSVLEAMTISCNKRSSEVELELLKDISGFPRKSLACKVKFIGRNVKSV